MQEVFGMNFAWTEQEKEILREYYPSHPKENVMKELPRTWDAIVRRASLLGVRRRYWNKPILADINLKISDTDVAWLACAIDSEGAIGIYKHHRRDANRIELRPYLSLANKNVDFLHAFTKKLGNRTTPMRIVRSGQSCLRVDVSRMSILSSLLKRIMNWLIIKKKHAQLVLEFIEIHRGVVQKKNTIHELIKYTPRQFEIYEEIKKINSGQRL